MFKPKDLHNPAVSQLLLRLGLGFVFAYAGVSSLKDPNEWVGYLPNFLAAVSYVSVIMRVFAVVELGLAVWLVSGKFVHYAALLAAAMLAGILLANPANLIITFRDVGLVAMALALFFAV